MANTDSPPPLSISTNIIVDPIEEASHGPLFEDISEQPSDMAVIEDVELPQAYEQLHVEDEKLPQVCFGTNNTCVIDLPHEMFLNDISQIKERFPVAYFSPLQCYIDEACTPTCYMIEILKGDLCLQHELFYDNHTLMALLGHIYNIFDETLFWLMTKHKGRSFIVDEELRWLHWLYHYT